MPPETALADGKQRRPFFVMVLLIIGWVMVLPELRTGNIGVRSAEAIVGRPASPNSVVGVRRRTRRRTARRTTYRWTVGTRVYVLPDNCVWQGDLYYCDGTYFRPYYQGNTVVYVVEG